MSFTFQSEVLFVDSFEDVKAKIEAIDLIIAALLVQATASVSNSDIDEYSLDDGQTKIKTKYRGVSAIAKAIQDFQKLRQIYINSGNGRVVQLRDSKSVIFRFGHHGHH